MGNTYTAQHEPGSEFCWVNLHCYSCNKDEDPEPKFIVCPECFHVYRSRRALKWAYIKQAIRAYEYQKKHYHSSQGPGYFRIVFRRIKAITFCQECLHDF